MILVAPSILSANFAQLGKDIGKAEESGADWLHIDVMDGHFVPNLTIGPQVVADIRPITNLILDVHLMIEKPERLIPAFCEAGADLITVHSETCPHLHRTIYQIKEKGIMAGVAINPSTPTVMIENILSDIDLVLVMSVNPGYGGQQFIPGSVSKVAALKNKLVEQGISAYLQVDGGINAQTGLEVVKAGCNVLVAGSYIFKSNDISQAINSLHQLG
ncbi:MAG: ribulose-phosphate 3-epimerase [Syntrophomonadaceae bacterium]|nr:ribulose-phosphate 3-epimerase [Syntrophomonadaceae bacterium]